MRSLPMLRALVPFAAGILLAEYYVLPWWFVAAAFLLCGVVALLLRSSAAVAGLLVAVGWGVGQFHAPVRSVPVDTLCVWEIEVEGLPADRGRYFTVDGAVRAWKSLADDCRHPACDRVVLRTDSLTTFPAGGRIRCFGRIRPWRDDAGSYGRLMARRGFVGTLSLSGRDLIASEPAVRPGIHLRAASRMRRICSADDAGAVVRAMTVADRSALTPELRAAYSGSGMSHLLAVSGLHTGIVFLLINFVLRGIVLLRRGHLLRDLLAVGAVWLYVAAAGFPPSAVRAAVMCTLLQAALAAGSEYAALNALAAAAFGMLLWNPAWIGDVGFLLSFIAVAAILLWAVPLCRRLRTGRRAIDLPVGLWVVGFTATFATAPLVSHAFGTVSVAGLLLNPAVIPLAGVAVLAGVAGMLLPVCCCVGEVAARLLNGLALATASVPGGSIEYALSAGWTWACYAIFVAATAAAYRIEPKKKRTFVP
ncbi:MAG: ComEC/Rec2 family competence protein [Alistipes sp.]|nr:ComEC/Rec2 family competence protein [Alistipes senegalensis]MCM1250752.1 ComEC/Rec2 family competence protein [Alistipes sp.]